MVANVGLQSILIYSLHDVDTKDGGLCAPGATKAVQGLLTACLFWLSPHPYLALVNMILRETKPVRTSIDPFLRSALSKSP